MLDRHHVVATALACALAGAGAAFTAEPPAAADASSATGVQGTAKLEGAAPKRYPLQMAADPKCAAMHAGQIVMSEETLVDAKGGLANVFVYVKNPPPGAAPPATAPTTPVRLEQHGCLYTPRVQGILVDQKLEIVNGDDTLHNVRALADKNRPFNIGQPPETPPRVKTFTVTEPALKFKCDVHPWMFAYLFVMDHPYFGVSGADGTWKLPKLPAGTYTVVAWHEKLGQKEAQVSVGPDGVGSAAFVFTAPAQ
jgi:hypothetical protein